MSKKITKPEKNIDLLYDFCEERREALKVHPDNQTEEQRALLKVKVVRKV